jgi:hypothetical protein
MKITSITVAVILSAGLFSACATQPAPRWFYKESQFSSRVEYLRFCQRYALYDRQCERRYICQNLLAKRRIECLGEQRIGNPRGTSKQKKIHENFSDLPLLCHNKKDDK